LDACDVHKYSSGYEGMNVQAMHNVNAILLKEVSALPSCAFRGRKKVSEATPYILQFLHRINNYCWCIHFIGV